MFKKALFFTVVSLIAIFVFPQEIEASESLLITSGISTRPSNEGELIHSGNFNLNYSGQRITLSSTTDGMGNVDVNDTVEVLVTNPDGVVTRYTRFFGGCGGPIDDQPNDLTSLFTSYGESVVTVNIISCGIDASAGPLYLVIEDQQPLLDTGFVSPTSFQILRGNWQNPQNVFENDVNFATVGSINSGERAIRYSGYKFDIPIEAEIKGIVVRIDSASNGWGGLNNIYQSDLVGNHGITLGSSHLRMGTVKSYIGGSPRELWGLNWNPENIENIKVEYGAAPSNLSHQLYWIAVKIYYVLPTPSAVVLKVPSMKQGLFPYDNNDPAWESLFYDDADNLNLTCGLTMAQCGCALTSAAMVMKYHGVDKAPSGVELNPSLLNEFAKGTFPNGGFYGFNSGNFRWEYAGNFSAQASQNFPGQVKIDQPIREDFNINRIKQLINEDRPVIVKVMGPWGQHWVVVKGYETDSDRLIINDPAKSDKSDFTYLDEIYTPQTFGSMIIYRPTHSDYRYIQFTTGSNNHMLVTDHLGNKTGFDLQTNMILKQIPNSDYVLDEFYGDATSTGLISSSMVGVNYLTLQLPKDGEYSLQIVRLGNQTQKVDIYSSNIEGQFTSISITPFHGNTKYVVNYDAISAGQDINVKKQVTIDSMLAELELGYQQGQISKNLFQALKAELLTAKRFYQNKKLVLYKAALRLILITVKNAKSQNITPQLRAIFQEDIMFLMRN